MEKKEIQSLSLSQLIEANSIRKEDLYHEGCLIASKVDFANVVHPELLRYPVRIDAYAIGVCSKGSLNINSNLNHYTLSENALYVNLPGSIIQVESMADAEVYLIMCSEDFIRRINVDLKLLTGLFLQLDKNPLIPIPENDLQPIIHSFEDIASEWKTFEDEVYTVEIVRTAIRMLIYKLCRVIDHHIKEFSLMPFSRPIHNRQEEYFHRFMQILGQYYMQERSVGFYAGQLNLTPKYLTTIIRQTSGRSALNWIDEYVILEAKNLLKYSAKSIQEIAYYLNFPNQSFFGKYFKNHTGITPSAYRMQK